MLHRLNQLAEKGTSCATLLGVMSCGACFPALASLGAALGFGFLQQYEGLFISRLLPALALLALLLNLLGYWRHRQWWRTLLGMLGPTIVLLTLLWWMGHWWTARLMYTGLALMLLVSLADLVWPAHRRCREGQCATKEASHD